MPPAPFDRNQVPTRDPGANHEYIRLNNGTRRLVRVWDIVTRSWKYTALGKRFFAQKQVEYVAQVPVRIEGSRRDGRGAYEKRTHLPVDLLGMGKLHVSALLSDDEAREHLKARILAHVGFHEAQSTAVRLVLYRFSEEEYIYDPRGEWAISSMITEPRVGGGMVTQVVLDRLMQGLRPLPPDLLHPELLIPEALVEGDSCVPLQLAAVMKVSRAEVERGLDLCAPRWRVEGVTPRQILAFCETRDWPCYVVYGHRLIERFVPEHPRHRTGVAFAYGHAWFYQNTHAVSRMQVREAELPPASKLARERRERTADISKWKPWAGQFNEPGTYYTQHIEDVRRQFLQHGLSPHVTLSSRTQIASLTLCLRSTARPEETSSSSDDDTPPVGSVVVRCWPDHATEIQGWVEAVAAKAKLPLKWSGQGLGDATANALTALLLQRHRVRPSAQLQQEIIARQQGRCAACDGICEWDDREFDHVAPLRDAGEAQLFQLLCMGRHALKTKLEPRCTRDPLASVFSKHAWEAYVESPQLPPLTFQTHLPQEQAGEIHEIDTRRCRRNALLHSAHHLSTLLCARLHRACRTEAL